MTRRKPEPEQPSAAPLRVRAPAAPGIAAFGPMRPGEIYELPREEAERLVRCKGFTFSEQE